MQKTITAVVLLVGVSFVVSFWIGQGGLKGIVSGSSRRAYDRTTAQLIRDVDFFTARVDEGQWVHGLTLAARSEKAFRTTGDYTYLARAGEAVRTYLEHEETADAYALSSSIALTQHEFTLARAHAERALTLAEQPTDRQQALGALFDAQAALGDIAGLGHTLRELQGLDEQPSYGTLVREARFVDRVHGNPKKAAELFARACDFTAEADDLWNHAWCLTQLTTYRLRSGAPLSEVANDAERITTNVYPDFPPGLELRGTVAALAGDYETSAAHFENARARGITPDVSLALAEVALLENDRAIAERFWRDYLAALGAHRVNTNASANAIVHVRGLVQALASLGDTDRALREARADLQKRPNDPGAHHTLAFLYLLKGQHREALAESAAMTDRVVLTGEEAFVRGAALFLLGNRDAGREYLAIARKKERDLSLRARRAWRELLPGSEQL